MYKILDNKQLTPDVYRMVLQGDTSAITAPGQFINILIPGKFLRRPISICDYDSDTITVIYKVVGEGTAQMCRMQPGEMLDCLVGLGNGFDASKSQKPLLIGGGVGVPPLYRLAKECIAQGKTPTVILGFNTKSEVFLADEFRALGCAVWVTTVDGSLGTKGFVTDAMGDVDYDYFFTCGPLPMFKAIYAATDKDGQFSFEERMGCGFGACMGCSCRTKHGAKRICKDGPVLEKEEILW